MTRIPEIDFKEQTACGGRVRYTIDPETDFIVYSCFTDCKAGLICRSAQDGKTSARSSGAC